jgi:hypothetical protein
LKGKLYAKELLTKLATEEELHILEAVWDEELSIDEKIEHLLKKKEK